MLHSKKLFMLLTLAMSLQSFADWREQHDERKAIHRKMDKKERAEKQAIDKKDESWSKKHKERKADHAKIKAEESKEKARLEKNKNKFRNQKADYTSKEAEKKARKVYKSKK